MKVLFLVLVSTFSIAVNASELVLAQKLKFESDFLGEKRTILVKLPEQYDVSDKKYPVLYVLHAQWDMLSTLSTVDLLEGQVPNFIVIGVEGMGMELRPDQGKPTAFSQFLSREVVPYVNNNYRTADFSILSGHSNAGRFVLDYWLNNKAPFSQYYAFSPSLEDSYINGRVSNLAAKKLKVMPPLTVTIANEGEHMQTPFDNLSQALTGLSDTSFTFQKFPEQSHRTTKHHSMQFALQHTFDGWEPAYELKVSGFNELTNHYRNLSEKFGFKVLIPTNTLQRLMAHYAISKSENAANELKMHIAYTLEEISTGIDATIETADYLLNNGYAEAGEIILKEMCNQAKDHTRCKG
ncbi:esterase [Microbulbifer sp. A4B17]|uniref:alpha/beta hydrolase n=1 Tax=Microbulbifer sp. A4B17 TaxID=359370 RepID=UPI000D52E12A|nr:alpha/beta hydrolase-fold protein [Microbulbifer sp. A4B17]AWF80877.1 esterase [Microbulbifer sp. A4B17]